MFFLGEDHKMKFVSSMGCRENLERGFTPREVAFIYLLSSDENLRSMAFEETIELYYTQHLVYTSMSRVAVSLMDTDRKCDINEVLSIRGLEFKVVLEAMRIAAGYTIISIADGEVYTYNVM